VPPVRASSTGGLIFAALDGSARALFLRLSAVPGAVTALVAFTFLSGTAARCVVLGALGIGRDRGRLAAAVVVSAGDVQAAQADLALGAVGRRVGDPVQVSSPVSGATYTRGQVVGAGYRCQEGIDGPACWYRSASRPRPRPHTTAFKPRARRDLRGGS
jgi:hypothetical protein